MEGYKGGFEQFCELFLQGNGKKTGISKFFWWGGGEYYWLVYRNYEHLGKVLLIVSRMKTTYPLHVIFAVCFGPFWDHVLGYWEQRRNPNVLILTYEDMKKVSSSTHVKKI